MQRYTFAPGVVRAVAALILHCALLCAGLVVLTGVGWLLAIAGLEVLMLPAFGLGLLILFPVTFALAVRFAARWLPRPATPHR